MRSSLEKLLKKNIPLLADGATGTSFMSMGLEPGFPPDLWNISHPEKPSSLHRSFAEVGSDIILTNTFGANRPRLKLHNAESETYAINKAGAKIIGGCCGTAPEHISHMRSAIDNHVASNRPSMEQVIEKLGSLASPPAKEGAKGSRGKRNRGRQ